MSKKGISLSIETVIVFIIILVALAVIIFIIFGQNTKLFQSLSGITKATTELAKEVQIPQP